MMKNFKRYWVEYSPVCITAALVIGFLVLWQVQVRKETSYQSDLVSKEADRIAIEIAETVKQTSNAMQRFATRIEYFGVKDKVYLGLDSKSYLNQLKILKRVGVIDAKYQVVWSYPADLSFQVLGFRQSDDPIRLEAMEDARRKRTPSLSKAIELKSGGLGFLLPVPLFKNDMFFGFIYATVEADKLFNSYVASKDFQIKIREKDQVLFQSSLNIPTASQFSKVRSLSLGNTNWEIEVIPSEIFVATSHSNVPNLILMFGAMIALMSGAYFHVHYRAKRNAIQNSINITQLNTKLELALNSANMAAWNQNLETGASWRSDNHDQMFGHRSNLEVWNDEMLLERIIEEDRALFLAGKNQALEGLGKSTIEVRVFPFNSTQMKWIVIEAKKIVDVDGGHAQVIGTIRDVTLERLAALETKVSSEWRKTILDASPYSIISTDAQGIIQTFNKASSQMFGYEPSEIIGKTTPQIFHLKSEVIERSKELSAELGRLIKPGMETMTAKAKMSRSADEKEWTFCRKDGSQFPVNLTISVIYDLNGEITGYLGISTDLTEKKKIQRELEISTERLKRVIESSGEGIWERQYNDSKNIEFIDIQARRIFGFAENESIDYAKVISKIHIDDRARLGQEIVKQSAEGSGVFDVEVRMQPEEKEKEKEEGAGKPMRWLHARGKIVREVGKEPRLLSTIRDATLEVESRMQLSEALQIAKEATRAKAEFLANMSHELRTPLNGVIGMADLLIETELNKEQVHFASIIHQSGNALLHLINDILDFSKIEAGKLIFERLDVSLAQLTETQAEVLAIKAKEKNISLMTFISPDLPSQIYGDPARLSQVLLNLIGNAIKFTESGGVTIRVTKAETESLTPTHCLVRFEVEDTGIGLSSESRDRLFKPFVQAEDNTARKYGGTGLGLSICKNIVELMGGRIGVDSIKGTGSIFWIELPLEINFDSKGKDLRSAIPHGKCVLVIDEDPIARKVLRHYLEALGFKVSELTSHAKAIAFLKAHATFDLIMVSYGSLSGEGLQLGKEILHLNRGQESGLILIDEFGRITSQSLALDNGFTKTLSKPVRQNELYNCLLYSFVREHSSNLAAIAPVKIRALPSENAAFKILIADDNAINRVVAVKIIEKLGYSVDTATDGFEVLERLSKNHYDLILMDCHMPGMDGYEATRRIRDSETFSFKDIPIIAFTANAMSDDSKLCLDVGMNDYLAKPIKRELLEAKLDFWFKQLAAHTIKAS